MSRWAALCVVASLAACAEMTSSGLDGDPIRGMLEDASAPGVPTRLIVPEKSASSSTDGGEVLRGEAKAYPTMGRIVLGWDKFETLGNAYYAYLLIPENSPALRTKIDAAVCEFLATPTMEHVRARRESRRDNISAFVLPVDKKEKQLDGKAKTSVSKLHEYYDFSRASRLLQDLAHNPRTRLSSADMAKGIKLVTYGEPLFTLQRDNRLGGVDPRWLHVRPLDHLSAEDIAAVVRFVRLYPRPGDVDPGYKNVKWGDSPYPPAVEYFKWLNDKIGDITLDTLRAVGIQSAYAAGDPACGVAP